MPAFPADSICAHNSPNAKAYPITAPTWLLVYTTMSDAAKKAAVVGFVNFILSDCQGLAKDVDYAPLPANFITATKARVAGLG